MEEKVIDNSIGHDVNDIIVPQSSPSCDNICVLNKEIKLPKSPLQWSTTYEYFKSTLSHYPIKSYDLNSNVSFVSTAIYGYCLQNYGFANDSNNVDMQNKYRDFHIKDLKKELKQLKLVNNNAKEIKLVSCQLRIILNKRRHNNGVNLKLIQEEDCNNRIKRNFWGFVNNVFQKRNSFLTTCSKVQC